MSFKMAAIVISWAPKTEPHKAWFYKDDSGKKLSKTQDEAPILHSAKFL